MSDAQEFQKREVVPDPIVTWETPDASTVARVEGNDVVVTFRDSAGPGTFRVPLFAAPVVGAALIAVSADTLESETRLVQTKEADRG